MSSPLCPYLGGGEEHVVGLLCGEEVVDRLLADEVEFGVGACYDVGVSLSPQLADDGRTDHAAVTRNVDLGIFSILSGLNIYVGKVQKFRSNTNNRLF